jgi:hypothetical protein
MQFVIVAALCSTAPNFARPGCAGVLEAAPAKIGVANELFEADVPGERRPMGSLNQINLREINHRIKTS